MKYVKAVQGTVKKGWTGTLGPKTLIVGPNMSGKSTITNTVELALTAEAYDIAGREHLQKEDLLLRHLGQDGKPLIARATFDSGETALFEIKRSKTGASKKAEHVLPPGLDPSRLLPLRPLRDAVLGMPERARRFFVTETARSVSEEDIRKRLPKALYPKYEAAIGAVKASWTQPTGREPVQTPIDDLIAVAALSKKREREWADKSALSRSTANVIAKDVPPSEEQLKAAEKDASDAQAALEEAVRRQTLIDSAKLGATRAESLRSWRKMIEMIETNIQEYEKRLVTLPEPPSAGIKASAEAAIFHAETERQDCLVCGRRGVPIQTFLERAAAARRRLDDSANDVRRDHTAQLEAWRFDLRVLTERCKAVQDQAVDAPPLPEAISIEDARKALQQASERLRELSTAYRGWEAANASRGAALEQARTSQGWGELSAAASEVVSLLMRQGVDDFVARVQKHLPASDKFGLRLTETLCEYGLEHDGILHTALSGSENVRVLVALATACLRPDAFPGVIIPEDRAWDSQTLSLALEAFSTVEAQVILTSTVEPTSVPEGWTVIRL